MPTLVLLAPYSDPKVKRQHFERVLANGLAEGYPISGGQVRQLAPGDDVIILCTVHKKQAAGTLKQLVPTIKASNGLQCYNVVIDEIGVVPFTLKNVKLSRHGVAVI